MNRTHAPTTVALAALALLACADASPTNPAPARTGPIDLASAWERADPTALGMDHGGLERAADRARELGRVQSLLVVRQGRLVLERYMDRFTADSLADVRSVTKSVVSLLTGIALERGELPGLDATIGELLPAAVATVPEAQRGITLRHLLTMSGGWAWDETTSTGYNDWVTSDDPVRYLLDRPLATDPGTRFRYNSAAVHLLGVILAEAVGPLPAYTAQHLSGPLGVAAADWETFDDGRVNGGSGLRLRPRDLARLGQLMLQEGRSGSRQVIPAAWVADATARAGWTAPAGPTVVSYGYLWWTDESNHAYMAWGYGGQFVYVAPERDLVVVATTRWRPRGDAPRPPDIALDVLRLIVEDVLPAAPPL